MSKQFWIQFSFASVVEVFVKLVLILLSCFLEDSSGKHLDIMTQTVGYQSIPVFTALLFIQKSCVN